MWLADVNVVLSYWLLGRKRFRVGWILNASGSVCFIAAGFLLQLPALWTVNILFFGIGVWNLVKEIYGKQQSS